MTNYLKGSPDYVIKSDLNDFSPIRGVNIITVKDRNIVAVDVLKNQFPGYKNDLHDYTELTIDGMFQKAFTCVSDFPRLVCSFEYDSEYGYPKKIDISCLNPYTCYESYETIDVVDVQVFEKGH